MMKHRTMTMILTTVMLIVGGVDGWGQDTWKKTFGGSEDEFCNSITTTSVNGVLITGYTWSNDDDFEGMNKGLRDIFVIKLDKDGEIRWKKTFGGTNEEAGESITTTSDNGVLITGYTVSNDGDFEGMNKGHEDIFVIKLDKDGNSQWKKTFGGTSSERGNSITTTSDKGVLITGYTYSNDDDFEGRMNKDSSDIFVIKLDKDGEILWKSTFGGTGGENCHSITTTLDNGVLITGYTSSNNGDFEGMGKGDIATAFPRMDIFVIKLDKDGKILWKKTFGGTDREQGYSITTTSDNGVLITGFTASKDGDFKGIKKREGQDIFVIKLDKDGNSQWKKTFGGSGVQNCESVTTTSDNSVLITGYTSSNNGDFVGMNKGRSDIFVIKLDKGGEILWKKTFGGTDSDLGFSVTTTSDNGVLITGYTTSIDGDFEGMNKSSSDVFVIKLDSNGSFNPSTAITDVISITTSLFVSPNPLSISSTVMFTTGSPSIVRIELLNTLGETVGMIYDGFLESSEHRVPLNISSVSSGVYYLRMTSERRVNSTQVVVVK